ALCSTASTSSIIRNCICARPPGLEMEINPVDVGKVEELVKENLRDAGRCGEAGGGGAEVTRASASLRAKRSHPTSLAHASRRRLLRRARKSGPPDLRIFDVDLG